MFTIDLCLSDIPNSACRKSTKNNKIYVNLVLSERKEPDDYDNTHSLFISQTKQQRTDKVPKIYCGSGKYVESDSNTIPGANPFTAIEDNAAPSITEKPDDDLPF